MADLLLDFLARIDDAAQPLEQWGREDFDAFRRGVVKHFQESREMMNASAVRAKRIDAGLHASAAHSAEAKAVRQHLRLIEPDALRFVERLTRLALNQKTRDRTLLFIREWRAAHANSGASPRQLAQSLLDFLRQDHRDVPSDNLTRQLLQTIERGDFETEGREWPIAQGQAARRTEVEHWTYELLPSEEADRRQQFLPAPDIDQKLQRAMVEYARSLGDRDSDLMILAMWRFAERAKHPDDKVQIGIDELMEALGYEKHRGGKGGATYRAEDKATVRERFEALQTGYLTIRKAGTVGTTSRSIDVESKVLMIEDRAGQADLDGRVREWAAVTVRFGRAWAYRLFDPAGRLTAIMQAKALKYHPQRERLEKRLLKRLGWYWRMNLERTTSRRASVHSWISEDIGDAPEEYARSRDAIGLEDAFERLRKHGQIAAWRYVDGHPRIGELAGDLPKGWRDRWLEREIEVEAPQALQLAYTERRKTAKAVPASIEVAGNIGARFRACRVTHGVSALKAAADLGLDNTVLSRIETGKRRPTEEQHKALEAWIAARAP